MKVLQTRMTSVTVEVKRSVGVGRDYNISGSYGYAGIDTGTIRVIALGHTEDLYSNPDVSEDIAGQIEAHIQAEVDNYGSDDTEEVNKEAVQREKELSNGIWVVYIYKTIQAVEEQVALPLDLFLEHTSYL